MNILLIALLYPLFHAIVNHLDKYLLSKHLKEGGAGALMIFSSLFSIVVLPIIYIIEPGIFSLTLKSIGFLILSGVLFGFTTLFYLFAMNEDDASTAAPFSQAIPVFGFIFAYFILGETMTMFQMLGSLCILAGGLILAFEEVEGVFVFKGKLIGFVLASIIPYALMEVLFKYVAVDEGFWQSSFWQYGGYLLFGLVLFIFHTSYRKEFINLLSKNSRSILALNFSSETLSLVGDRILAFAILLFPIALVQSIGSLQGAFVFLIGIIITIFFPHIGEEDISKKVIIKKIIALAIMFVGSVILFK